MLRMTDALPWFALALSVASLAVALSACGGAAGVPAGGPGAAPGGAAPVPLPPGSSPAATAGAPVVAGRNRNGAPVDGGGLTLLLVGSGLDAGAAVTFGGVPSPGVLREPMSGGLVVAIPPHAEGFADIVVTNPDGQQATSPGFHYGPPPAILMLSPTAGIRRGDPVTVSGGAFDGVQVSVGGVLATVAAQAPDHVVFVAPKLNPGSYPVVVTNLDGQYDVAADALTYP
jgi:hypothetical protein